MKDIYQKNRGRCVHDECSTKSTECPEFCAEENKTTFSCAYCGHYARFHDLLDDDKEEPLKKKTCRENANKALYTVDSGNGNISKTMEIDVGSSTAHDADLNSSLGHIKNTETFTSAASGVASSNLKVYSKYCCAVCDFKTNNYRVLRAHVRRLHKRATMKMKCPQCPAKFFYLEAFRIHNCQS